MIFDAPLIFAPCATANPTDPSPKIATDEPGSTLATFHAAPYSRAGAAAEEAGELGRHGGVELDDLGHVHDGVLAEARDSDHVVQRGTLGVPEPDGAVSPHPRTHDEGHRGAHGVVLRRAARAAVALAHERRRHRVARGEALHELPDALDHSVGLVSQDSWKCWCYLCTPKGDVRVAEGGADNLDADLVLLRWIHDDLLYGERLAGGSTHCRFATDGLGVLVLHGNWAEENGS
uniref:Pco147721a n=1 Tax=Arundo donax TaxID=35708 RepID=A0A0A9EX53_ARUDO